MANQLLPGIPERHIIAGVDQTERVLGVGAYGEVFEGQWRGTKVAIKRHHSLLVRDEHGQLSSPYRRFLEEFTMLKELPHPNIVQVFGMVQPNMLRDTPGLVMEFLQQTLRQRYDDSPQLTRLDEATVALGVVSALDYLHRRNVVHRDLTTNNIMVCDTAGAGGELKAKITDVGGAAMMANGAKTQRMTLNPGAQIYMSPETQIRVSGDPSGREDQARYGTPADCYSCAVSVMAMCNRREPPDIFTLMEGGRARDLESLGEDHPLHAIIVRCLEADPSLRPTASQLCNEIGEAQSRLKAIPVWQSAASGSTAADAHGAESLDVVRARAETADLRQAMAVMESQRVGLLRERDELLADRDRMAVENANLQRAVTDTETRHDALMRDLLAEQDRLLLGNGQLRRQGDPLRGDLSRARQSAYNVQQQACVLEVIATQANDTGMLARCALLLPAYMDSGKPATVPKWAAVGDVPACDKINGTVCVWHDRLFIATSTGGSDVKAASAQLGFLTRENWVDIDLPPGSATRGVAVDHRFFSHNGALYVLSSASNVEWPQVVWKRSGNAPRWERVAIMPEYRCRFSLSVVDSCLVVAGGSSSSDRHARAHPDVISLSLAEDGADWVAWPPWPSPSSAQVRSFPSIAATTSKVHIVGGEVDGARPTAVFTADLSTPPEERLWSTGTIPPLPKPQCAAVVANDHLVALASPSRFVRSSKAFMYSAISKTWLPLPDMTTKYTEGSWRPILVSTVNGILVVSRHGLAGLRW